VRDADGRIIGLTTSGAFGHTVGKSLAFAYVEPAFQQPGTKFDIQLFGELHQATVLAEPAYDPKSEQLRV
jgi:dimethylglycine dehydrogenase